MKKYYIYWFDVELQNKIFQIPTKGMFRNTLSLIATQREGRLIRDNQEGLVIEWNNLDKVKRITRLTKSTIDFSYDAMGNRISKKVTQLRYGSPSKTTYYVRDASGNPMAVYSHENQESTYTVDEHTLYGSDRVGIYTPGTAITNVGGATYVKTNPSALTYIDGIDRRPLGSETEVRDGDRYFVLAGDDITNKEIHLEGGTLVIEGNAGGADLILNAGKLIIKGSLTQVNLKINENVIVENFGTLNTTHLTVDPAGAFYNYGTTNQSPSIEGLARNHGSYFLAEGLYNKNAFIGPKGAVEELTEDYLVTSRTLDHKTYELKDHLGNVRVTVSDRKLPDAENAGKYIASITSYNDYYPFGSPMPERSYSSPSYRYGFQGQEKDDEVKGEGNSVNYKYRMHDPRLGRFFAVDPLASKYPYYSPYAFSGNRVIDAVELEGLEPKLLVDTWNAGMDFYNEYEDVIDASTDILGGALAVYGGLNLLGSSWATGPAAPVVAVAGAVTMSYGWAQIGYGMAKLGNALKPKTEQIKSLSNSNNILHMAGNLIEEQTGMDGFGDVGYYTGEGIEILGSGLKSVGKLKDYKKYSSVFNGAGNFKERLAVIYHSSRVLQKSSEMITLQAQAAYDAFFAGDNKISDLTGMREKVNFYEDETGSWLNITWEVFDKDGKMSSQSFNFQVEENLVEIKE